MKGLMRFIPWWALALLLLVYLGWVFRVALVETAVNRILAGRGISNVSYELRDIDLSRIELDSFEASGEAGGVAYDIAATNLEIRYRIDKLTSGKIGETAVGNLDITVQTTPGGNASPFHISDILELLEARFNLAVPADRLDIQRMTVVYDTHEVLTDAGLSGQFGPGSNQIALYNGSWNADLTWAGHSAEFQLDAADPRQEIISASITLDPDSPTSSFSASVQAQAAEVAQWASAVAAIHQSDVNGSLEISAQGIRTDNRWDLNLDLVAPTLGFGEMELSSLNARTLVSIPDALDPANLFLEILAPGRITADALTVSEIELLDIRFEPAGTLQTSDTGPTRITSHASALKFSQLVSDEIRSGEATVTYSGKVAMDKDGLQIGIDRGSQLVTAKLAVDDIELRNVSLEPSGTFQSPVSGPVLITLQTTALEFSRFDSPDIRSDSAKVNYSGTIAMENDGLLIGIEPGSRLVTPGLTVDEVELRDLSAESRAPIAFLAYPESGSWQLENGSFTLDRVELDLDEVSARFNDTTLDISLASADELTASFAATAPELHWQDIDSGISEIEGIIEMRGDRLETRGTAMVEGIGTSLSYDTSTNLADNLTKFTVATEDTLEPGELLSLGGNFTPDLIPGLELDSGDIKVAVSGTIPDQGDSEFLIEASAESISGSYADTLFSGAELTVATELGTDATTGSAAINVDAIEYGVEISDIGCELAFTVPPSALPLIMVDRCTGTTLGSQIEAPGFTFDMNAQENSMQLNITGLDITRVLETQEFEGLEATGRLDGTLPLSLGPAGLSISGGQLRNQSTGTIRYQLDPDQATSVSNPLTDVVMAALSDFTYDVLTADVDYDPAGDLFVNFHIQGSSPNFENGRPVHLNINSEQNILSLLESLQYTGNLNQQIDDKVRKNLE